MSSFETFKPTKGQPPMRKSGFPYFTKLSPRIKPGGLSNAAGWKFDPKLSKSLTRHLTLDLSEFLS